MSATDIYIYNNRPEIKYSGYDFDYMNSFSNTNLASYYLYAVNSKLVTLKEDSHFIIENQKDMPILDGAEACYPVYSAIGYERLFGGECDMFFGAKASTSQLEIAKEMNVE